MLDSVVIPSKTYPREESVVLAIALQPASCVQALPMSAVEQDDTTTGQFPPMTVRAAYRRDFMSLVSGMNVTSVRHVKETTELMMASLSQGLGLVMV